MAGNTGHWFSGSSSSSGGGNTGSSSRRSHDIGSQSGLTNLYNQKVVHSEGVRRPLEGMSNMYGPISHSGTVVTTKDGSKLLVHKGDGYGDKGGDTVVTSAKHMSGKWEPIPGSSRNVEQSRVGDFVGVGGKDYSKYPNNCHKARKNMSKLP